MNPRPDRRRGLTALAIAVAMAGSLAGADVVHADEPGGTTPGTGAQATGAATPGATPAVAPVPDDPKILKVCEDPDNMPFSNARHEGIENRIAAILGREMGVPVEYFDLPQRMNFVRNSLRYKLPGEDYRCDLMISAPVGFGQVATTRPYYRSTWAVVFRRGGPFDGVDGNAAFLDRLKSSSRPLKVGVFDRSPGARWLEVHGLADREVMFRMLSPDPSEVPGRIIDDALVNGTVDAAIAWGPVAAFHARRVSDRHPLQVVPLKSERDVRFDFAVAMGVRHGEPGWKARVQTLIDARKSEIDQVLTEFGVPLVAPADATPDRDDGR